MSVIRKPNYEAAEKAKAALRRKFPRIIDPRIHCKKKAATRRPLILFNSMEYNDGKDTTD